MKQTSKPPIRDLIERIARINAAEEWGDNLNPTQRAALSYLVRANRFSRAPSQVADFMATTRGTVTQTLKALARKGLIEEVRSETDKRWISYSVTRPGVEILDRRNVIDDTVEHMEPETRAALGDGLKALVRGALAARNRRPFGVCETCRYHKRKTNGGYCQLLNEHLAASEVRQICHEHQEAA